MLTIEQIIKMAEESGASIDRSGETFGIGYTDLDGTFKTYTPLIDVFDDECVVFEGNRIVYIAA